MSGYVKAQIQHWDQVDWSILQAELDAIAANARKLGIWVVVGANHQRIAPLWPHNSLYVISENGIIIGRYDKRLISHAESISWYTPGSDPIVFEVDGFRFGCALCIEIHFPELFMEYGRLGVDGVLFSAYAEDPIFAVTAQAHAATNNIWMSVSTPAACRPRLPCSLIGPDGYVFGQSTLEQDLVYGTLDRSKYEIALTKARPWRASVRENKKGP
ncbi:putative nitrilase/N-carbamoyl-D-aminoacid amidohydrolase family protein [Bradyrhizobium sp. ORS 278]|nr:putative nitrilase/N-carbamoyl-D-aminoacid amidohydrolase family protein [Bradyrhizobium sp. ORS 278]